jgi:hypothetical protein
MWKIQGPNYRMRTAGGMVELVRNLMAHAQKPDFVFRLNGQVHSNCRGSQFSRLLAAEVCASALVMLDTPCSEVVWEYWLPTPFASFPFTSPSCVTVCHHIPNAVYHRSICSRDVVRSTASSSAIKYTFCICCYAYLIYIPRYSFNNSFSVYLSFLFRCMSWWDCYRESGFIATQQNENCYIRYILAPTGNRTLDLRILENVKRSWWLSQSCLVLSNVAC